jgi:hypothetical protein
MAPTLPQKAIRSEQQAVISDDASTLMRLCIQVNFTSTLITRPVCEIGIYFV